MARADVCLILEGTYPYVTGGVSSWTHDLLLAQKDLTFHLVTLLPENANLTYRYQIPTNVVGTSNVFIQKLPAGRSSIKRAGDLFDALQGPLLRLQTGGGLDDLRGILDALKPVRDSVGSQLLLNSPRAWKMLLSMYRESVPTSSFLDFFWSWRSLVGGLYSVLLGDLPDASVYHAVCTGYAGLLLARAHIETGRPTLLTEHGIYTNERRIEMAMANWLHDAKDDSLRIDKGRRALKDVWVDTFVGYSRACYEAATEIITLYEGNQQFQLQDGADPAKMRIIPNGVDYEHYSVVRREKSARPTIALIGRVVPIKDIKTFIRACGMVQKTVPNLHALLLGPTDEDETYYEECVDLVRHMKLEETVTFSGRVKLDEYLGRIDVLVLTSISEAQPLVVLEAGSLGIPSVTTDVGSCRDLIFGPSAEVPALGPAGDVTPLCNPSATAQALVRLLTDPDWYERCGRAIQDRVRVSYNKISVDRLYHDLYVQHLAAVKAA
jgi:glycosyltransferase involved in cell wall biosynthesis